MIRFKNVFILPLLLLVLFFLPFHAFAQNQVFNGQNAVTLNKDQVVNHDYFAAGKEVTIDGIINGDAYIAGGRVDINGIINGDLLVAGGQIAIRGNVSQNIRVVGGSILMQGEVGRNISLAGGNIVIDKNAKILGNTIIAGGNSEILSQIKELTLVGGNARLANTILGDVTAGVGMLELTPSAIINGNLNYWSNNKATVASGAQILKSTTFHQTNFNRPVKKTAETLFTVKILFNLVGFISSLILGILLVWLFPIFSQKTADIISGKFWLSLLVGFISLIVIPVAAVLLFMSIVGIPFAILLLFSYGFMIYISRLFAALLMGRIISTRTNWKLSPIWAFIIGLVIYCIIGLIPIVGGLMKLIVVFVGVGAFVMQEKYYFITLRDKKLL